MTTFEYYKLSIFENKLMIYMLIFLLSSAGNIASIYYKAVMHNQKPVYFKVHLKKTVEDHNMDGFVEIFVLSFLVFLHHCNMLPQSKHSF